MSEWTRGETVACPVCGVEHDPTEAWDLGRCPECEEPLETLYAARKGGERRVGSEVE